MIRDGRSPVKPAVVVPACRVRVDPGAIARSEDQEDGRRKPSSVSRPRRVGPGSFIWDPDRSGPRAAYPGLGRGRRPLVPYLALLRVGFAVRPLLPAARCALTAPFHPCLCPRGGHRRSALCGTFRRLATPGRYPAPCLAELGLSSVRRALRTPGGDPSARPPGPVDDGAGQVSPASPGSPWIKPPEHRER